MPDHGGGEAGHAGHRLQEDDACQDGALVQRPQVALHGVAGGQVEAESVVNRRVDVGKKIDCHCVSVGRCREYRIGLSTG